MGLAECWKWLGTSAGLCCPQLVAWTILLFMFSETQVSSHLLCILKSKEPTVEKVDFSGNLAAECLFLPALTTDSNICDISFLCFYHILMYLRLYWRTQFLEKSDYKRISATTKAKHTEKIIMIYCWVLRNWK